MVNANTNMDQQNQLHILVAEDNEINQKLIQKILVKAGYAVDIVENGCDAVAFAGKNRYDFILMDIQMPKMDGLEATRKIRSLQRNESVNQSCSIVGLSAHAMSGDREKYLAEGMVDYLTKPIRPEALQQVLDACASNKSR